MELYTYETSCYYLFPLKRENNSFTTNLNRASRFSNFNVIKYSYEKTTKS